MTRTEACATAASRARLMVDKARAVLVHGAACSYAKCGEVATPIRVSGRAVKLRSDGSDRL